MNWTVEYEPEAVVNMEKMTVVMRERIAQKIEWLAENLDQIIPQQLTGNLAGYYKLRVGDYRVIYDLINEEKVLIISQVGHRSEIYG
ncbi:MAG: type II toxin-antitoxin system RelE/ParE family toxin [Hormoscilla sp. GM7CHS1pb]|nr:type II toxin-antitoxin system RelE/ParE family toxin [Hormoscilla sp. GM7CHS1pb]